MVALQAWWVSVPEVAKRVLLTLAGASGTLVVVGAVLNIPARVTENERAISVEVANNLRQDAELAAIRADDAEDDRDKAYMICLLEVLAGSKDRTEMQCGNARIVQ